MKKILALLAVMMVLSGCDGSTTEKTNYIFPPGLKDCHIFKMVAEGSGRTLYVVRCPNSTTSTNYGGGKNDPATTVSYVEEY